MKIAFHMFNSFYATWYVQGVWKKTRGMKWILKRTCNANVILQYQIVWSNFLWLTHQPKSWKTRAFTACFAPEIFSCQSGMLVKMFLEELKWNAKNQIQLWIRKRYLRIKFLELFEKIEKKNDFLIFWLAVAFEELFSIIWKKYISDTLSNLRRPSKVDFAYRKH